MIDEKQFKRYLAEGKRAIRKVKGDYLSWRMDALGLDLRLSLLYKVPSKSDVVQVWSIIL